MGQKKFLDQKKFVVEKNFWVEKIFGLEKILWLKIFCWSKNLFGLKNYLLVPEKSWGRVNARGGRILPLPTENNRVKLCWVAVTLLL